MERYHVIGGHLRLDQEGTVTSYADAQATIAALEETILKMGENAAVVAKDAMAAKEQVAALQARAAELYRALGDGCDLSAPEQEKRDIEAITDALTETRRAALLECRDEINKLIGKDSGNWNRAIVYAADVANKLAQEGS